MFAQSGCKDNENSNLSREASIKNIKSLICFTTPFMQKGNDYLAQIQTFQFEPDVADL